LLHSQHRWIYGFAGYLGSSVVLDTETDKVTNLPIEPDEFVEEPMVVPKPSPDGDAWLIHPVLGESDVTESRLFDGALPVAMSSIDLSGIRGLQLPSNVSPKP
jgi:carotenoid cleavage dioxygenase-like enzyme